MSDVPKQLSYADYIRMSELLALQKPVSDSEHELPFIIVHQSVELFFKCALAISERILDLFSGDGLEGIAPRISRLVTMLETATAITKYQETLAPSDFAEFRNKLVPASGAQSPQFWKLVEHGRKYREAYLRLLQKEGLLAQSSETDDIVKAIHQVYSEPQYSELRRIVDALYDYEEAFRDHRWQHLKVARRVIGSAPGTGGTAGVPLLETRLADMFFPELPVVRSEIVRVHDIKFEKRNIEPSVTRKEKKKKKKRPDF